MNSFCQQKYHFAAMFMVVGPFEFSKIYWFFFTFTLMHRGSFYGVKLMTTEMNFNYIIFEFMMTSYALVALFNPPHDDVIKWKHFPRYWPFVRGIHRSPVTSPHKGQWRGALMFSLICVWTKNWVNNRETGDLRRYRVHCDVRSWVRSPPGPR